MIDSAVGTYLSSSMFGPPGLGWDEDDLKADSLLQFLAHTVGFTHVGNQLNQVFLDQQLIWI